MTHTTVHMNEQYKHVSYNKIISAISKLNELILMAHFLTNDF